MFWNISFLIHIVLICNVVCESAFCVYIPTLKVIDQGCQFYNYNCLEFFFIVVLIVLPECCSTKKHTHESNPSHRCYQDKYENRIKNEQREIYLKFPLSYLPIIQRGGISKKSFILDPVFLYITLMGVLWFSTWA